MTQELHEKIQKLADDYDISLNTAINMAIEEFVRDGKLARIEKDIEELKQEIIKLKSKK